MENPIEIDLVEVTVDDPVIEPAITCSSRARRSRIDTSVATGLARSPFRQNHRGPGTPPLAHFPWVIWNRIPVQNGSFQRSQAASA